VRNRRICNVNYEKGKKKVSSGPGQSGSAVNIYDSLRTLRILTERGGEMVESRAENGILTSGRRPEDRTRRAPYGCKKLTGSDYYELVQNTPGDIANISVTCGEQKRCRWVNGQSQ